MPSWSGRENYRKAFIGVAVLLFLYSLLIVRGIVLSFLLAGVLAYLFNPLVNRLENRGTGRTWAILLVYAAAAIVIASVVLYGLPRVVGQLDRLVAAIPAYTGQVQSLIRNIESRYSGAGLPPAIRELIDDRINWLENGTLSLLNSCISSTLALLGHIFDIFLAPVLAFYLLRDFKGFKECLFAFIPYRWRADVTILAGDINCVLDSYIRGYLLVCVIVGILTGLSMFILGVDYAFVLGLFAGLAELIPYFGPFIGSLPALSLALLESKLLALKVIAAFLIIQQLEGNIISPKVFGDRVGLHPLTVILALLLAGELFGLGGMLLAVPAAAILKIIASFAWNRLKIN